MRIIDIDRLDMPGCSKIKKILDRWEKEHPITEIVIRQDDKWDVILKRRESE